MTKYYLGIESSCDETAAAIISINDTEIKVHSSIIASQIAAHAPYGGVVPEIAARKHVEQIDEIVDKSLKEANLGLGQLSGIAATSGPGLIGGVMVGLIAAKAIALATDLPFIGVNHLEGHAISPLLDQKIEFPYILLLVSGGHCQILLIKEFGNYQRLGSTIDDALGEAFDKVAKILGLGYPGGPLVEKFAKNGDENFYDLPRPMIGRDNCDFSFAGLKTAISRLAQKIIEENGELTKTNIENICASFQKCVIDVLCDRLKTAFEIANLPPNNRQLILAGGVAANNYIRTKLSDFCQKNEYSFFAPDIKYCGDNGAMIALAGAMHLRNGVVSDLSLKPRPRWPLDENSQPMNLKHPNGKKGQKA